MSEQNFPKYRQRLNLLMKRLSMALAHYPKLNDPSHTRLNPSFRVTHARQEFYPG